MNSRLKNLGFGPLGSKRKSSSNVSVNSTPQTSLSPAPTSNGAVHTPTTSTSSTTSLPMNQAQNGLGRPPSYTYNGPRSTSPMPPQQQQVSHHPPPINTGSYPQGHPALGGAPQPPGYGGGYGQHAGLNAVQAPQSNLGQYGGRTAAVEVEGAGRSKAQLIVGIDFVSQASF